MLALVDALPCRQRRSGDRALGVARHGGRIAARRRDLALALAFGSHRRISASNFAIRATASHVGADQTCSSEPPIWWRPGWRPGRTPGRTPGWNFPRYVFLSARMCSASTHFLAGLCATPLADVEPLILQALYTHGTWRAARTAGAAAGPREGGPTGLFNGAQR